jgi:cell division protein FtsB
VLTLQTQNANLSAQVSALQSQVTSLQAQVTQQIKQISNLTIENNNLTAQVTALESQVSTLQSQVTSLQAQVTDLEAQITALEALVPTPPPKEGDPGSSRFFPLNIGKSINVQFTSGYPEVTFIANITIHNIVRGDAAWDMLYTYYDGNTPPAPGYEYILANITFRLVMASDIFTSYTVWSHSFDAVSKDGVVYNYVFVLEPEPALSNEVYQGATVTGWAAFMVSVVDNHPVLSFGTDYDGTGGGWFKLY